MALNLLIFGLSRSMPREELQALVAPCGESRLAMLDMPGDNDDAYAIVRLGSDERLARRLTERLTHRRLHGRRLLPWLCVLPWT